MCNDGPDNGNGTEARVAVAKCYFAKIVVLPPASVPYTPYELKHPSLSIVQDSNPEGIESTVKSSGDLSRLTVDAALYYYKPV